MAQEEHCNYSGCGGVSGDGDVNSGGRSSKKVKEKKVPQRGLGVAQLEKIRLEEQQKMDSLEALNVLGTNSINSPSFMPVSSPKYRSIYTSMPNLNAFYRQAQAPLFPSIIGNENPVQIVNGNESLGHGTWPRLWNSEHSLVIGEKQSLDHHGFGGCEVQQPYELSSPSVLTPIVSKRSSHPFPQPSSPLMVNTSPGISRSSVLLRSQIEPPSNQSSRSWSEEDVVVGAKRPYPFSVESHHNACPPSGSDELAPSINGHSAHVEPRNKSIREDHLSTTGLPRWNPSEVTRDNGKLSGDFLTLAPPTFSCPPLDTKHKHPLGYSGKEAHKLFGFDSVLSQEAVKNQMCQLGPSGLTEQSFSFFRTKCPRADRTTSCVSNSEGEKGEETLDLNLKL